MKLHFDKITSDMHVGHKNMRLWRGMGKSHETMDLFDDEIIDRWNDETRPSDDVLVLGDAAMGQIDDNLEKIRRLHGNLTLVPGNHDRCWVGLRKTHDRNGVSWIDRYLAVFSDILLPGVYDIDGVPGSVKIDHFPYRGDHGHPMGSPEDRYPEWRPDDEGHWLVHGHVHDLWRQNGLQINVGLDAWGGRPTNPDAIAALMADGEQWIDADAEWGFGIRPESVD
jgi:calcineurin-like phosphoesterase family protein